MKTILLLVFLSVNCCAQGIFCSAIKGTWEPNNLVTKAGLVASYDPGNQSTLTANGTMAPGIGISQMLDRSMKIRTGNLLLQSETFNTTWGLTRCNAFGVVDDGAAGSGSFANTARTADPLGGNTADFVQEDTSATTTHYLLQTPSPAIVAGTILTLSVCAKMDTTSHGTNIMLASNSASYGKGFDLSTGTAVAVSGITAPTSSSITSLGSGWYLCSITWTGGASDQGRIYCVTNSAGTYTVTYSGNNTKGIFLWGASLVKSDWTQVTGPTLAQGYQVTTTAAYGPPDLDQTTAANQPLISRTDNAGNLLKQSEAFNTTWSRDHLNAFSSTDVNERSAGSGSFTNSAEYPDPAGGNSADFLQEDGTVTTTHSISQGLGTFTGSFSFSIWLRPVDRNYVRFYIAGGSGGSDVIASFFNISAGTNMTATTGGGGLNAVSSVGNGGVAVNGFYLCNLSGTLPNAGTTTVSIYFSATGASSTYSGDNTSGVLMWGASLTSSSWTPVTGTNAAQGYVSTTTVPIFPGVGGRSVLYFDGSAYRLQTPAATINQPASVYGLFNHWTWTANDAVFDGVNNSGGKLYQSATTPNIRFNAGTAGTELVPPPLGTWQVDKVVFDGANSRIATNNGAYVVSDANTGTMGGVTLGSAGTAGTTYWNGLSARLLVTTGMTNASAEESYMTWGLEKQGGIH